MSPKCNVHKEVDAVTKCYKCGCDLCDKCRIDYFGKDICVECGKPLLSIFEPMLYNNPDILQPKKKFTDYSETGELIKH
jgi:hypothetical protein